MASGYKGGANNSFADVSPKKSGPSAIFDNDDELSQIKISDSSISQHPSPCKLGLESPFKDANGLIEF